MKGESVGFSLVDEGRKRVVGIMAAILSGMHMQRADDLFGMPNGSPITDRIVEASIQCRSGSCRELTPCTRNEGWGGCGKSQCLYAGEVANWIDNCAQ